MRIVKPSYVIEFLQDGEEILLFLERIGRTCYKSEEKITPGSARKFVKMLLDRGHHSVIEHANMTVRFICDRGVTHELVRHRLCSFSQESTRYCNYGHEGEITVIQPCFWLDGTYGYDPDDSTKVAFPSWERWKKACQDAEGSYLRLLDIGASPQEARSVLPNSLKTEIVTTANLREWRHIFTLRTSKAAHPQMREIMVPLLAEVQSRVPVLFDDIVAYAFEG